MAASAILEFCICEFRWQSDSGTRFQLIYQIRCKYVQ